MSIHVLIFYNDGTTAVLSMESWKKLCDWMMQNHGKYHEINAEMME